MANISKKNGHFKTFKLGIFEVIVGRQYCLFRQIISKYITLTVVDNAKINMLLIY